MAEHPLMKVDAFRSDATPLVSSQTVPRRDSLPVNILIVDDEPNNLTALEALLEGDERRLVRATSASEALKHLLQEDFAVILLDVHMPDMDGFETAELIRGRERTRTTPIIFLTAAIKGESFVAKGYALGAVDYIVKPLDPDVLRSKVGVFVDLFRKTEQVKQQAAALAETSAFLHSVLESATGFAIMALDWDGRILTWNEGARQLYGYTLQEVTASAGLETLHPDHLAPSAPVSLLLQAARDKGRVVGELDGLAKNGRRFNASLNLEQRLGADGRPTGFVAIVQDITLYRQAEQQRVRLMEERAAAAAAEAARDRLQQVVDVLPEGIVIADAEGRITVTNQTARDMIGTGRISGLREGAGVLRAFYQDGTPCAPQDLPLARVIERDEVIRGEQWLVQNASTGDLIPVLVSGAPLRDASGGGAGGVIAFQDISPIKELELQKDAFLAAASHDLKSPVTIIKGHAQALALVGPPEWERREAADLAEGLRSIDRASTRLTGMINELLDIARLNMGRPIELEPQRIDLDQLVRQVAVELQESSDRHELYVESKGEPLTGLWDAQRLERVVVNLVTNAIKFSPQGGRITLRIFQERAGDEEWAVLEVRDPGIGIPAQDLPHVFERFYRASNVAGRIEGAGIGLAAVRQLTELHNGEVLVNSRQGEGTTFTVRLPVGFTAAVR